MNVEEWTAGMDSRQLRACIARFEDETKALRARVAKLEAALEEARIDFEMWHETTSIAKIDAALKDAPQ